MKILLLHSDFIEWEPKKKAISKAEKVEKKPVKVKDALAVFCSVEKQDRKNPKKVAKDTASEIQSVQKQVKAKNIVLYPYVHLSNDPSSPDTAITVLKSIESQLKKPVFRASVPPHFVLLPHFVQYVQQAAVYTRIGAPLLALRISFADGF